MRRDIFQAIADPTRRAIIALIALQAMTPNALAAHFNTSRQAVSKHIQILTECELVKSEQNGREIYYKLDIEKMKEIDVWIEQFRKIWEDRFSQLDELLLTIQKNNKIMQQEIQTYHAQQSDPDKAICDLLYTAICNQLPDAEHKIWHRHPVWFIEGNPIVGYDKLKSGLRLMFWSGVTFEEENLKAGTGKFKDASIAYLSVEDINNEDLSRWLEKSIAIQWDYKNIVKRKGVLERLK